MTAWLDQLFLHFLSLLFCLQIIKHASVRSEMITERKNFHSSNLLTQILSDRPFRGSVGFPNL